MTPAQHIDAQIASFPDWRGKLLAQLREILNQPEFGLTEEWKWNTGVWTRSGMICATSAFKDHVKINFFKGVLLNDPHRLINGGLTSKNHRSIDFSESDVLNKPALEDLIRQAVALNTIS